MKKKIFLLLILLLIPIKINAIVISGCKTQVLSNLKSLASNVNLSYTYEIKNNNAYFKITINNITDKIYIVDNLGNKYTYNNSNKGEIITNEYKDINKISFRIYSSVPDCMDDLLITKYINLPTYNIYYNDPVCKGIEDYKLCQRWATQTLGYEEFVQEVNNYKIKKNTNIVDNNKNANTKGLFDMMFDIYINYYYIILPVLIVVCLSFVYIKNRKNKFNL